MNVSERINSLFRAPRLTLLRIIPAFLVAVAADGTQLILAEIGWLGLDQAIDCVAMFVITWLIGFHFLLLPTFLIELIPLADDLPTWTACTAAVIVLRKREQRREPPGQPPPPPASHGNDQHPGQDKPVIDI
jgi:hypothetical protein